MITQGFEHRLYFKLVSLGLPKGVEDVAEDTTRRKAYLETNPNFPNNMVLISCMTYCENVLNSSSNSNQWITDHGGIFVDVLLAMKIVRNSWTHNNGNISQNYKFNGMDGNEQYAFVKSTLQSNNADSSSYEFNDAETSVSVLSLGCNRISAVCTSVFKNAGLILIVEKKSQIG
jgi:hypothetical protein